MSDDRLFERNAQAWLEVGPSTAPKRVVDAALLAIETTPQQRDLRVPWRLPHLTMQTRFAVAAAIGVLFVGAGVLILRNPQQVGPNPTTSPSPSPVSMREIEGTWASVGTRNDPFLNGGDPTLQTMAIDAAGLRINGWKGELTSSASIADGNGILALRMDAPQELLTREHWDCTTGDNGTYLASLSGDAQTLTLTSASDACASRGQIITGDWTRWSCPDPSRYAYCDHVSELAPGRYLSPVFRPFWARAFSGPASGQLAYTVPAGWAKLSQPPTWPEHGTPSAVWLSRIDAPDAQAIRIFSNTYATYPVAVPVGSALSDLQCDFGIGSNGTATQVADFLESLTYLSVSGRAPITIGGLTGVQIDVALLPGFVDACTSSEITNSTEIQLLQDNGGQGGGIYLDYDGDAYARLILLDNAHGRDVIAVSAPDAAALAARVAEAMPVIASFEFIPEASAEATPAATSGVVWQQDIEAADVIGGNVLTADGSLLVVVSPNDTESLIYRISADGADVERWGDAGIFPAQLGWVEDIAVSTDGSVYAADFSNAQIVKFDASGGYLTSFGSPRNGDSNWGPEAIAIGPDGLVYVAWNHRVDIFDRDGALVRSIEWAGARPFGQLTGLAFANDRLYVADVELKGVWMLGPDFEVLGSFGSEGSGVGEFERPGLMAADADGHIYVTELGNSLKGTIRTQEFDGSGNYLETHFVSGPNLLVAHDVAIGPDGDLYVSAGTNSVQRQHQTSP